MFKFHECLGSKNNIYLIYVKFRAIFFYSECFLFSHIYIYICVCVYVLPGRLRAASVGSLAAMEVLTLQHGRVFPAAACHEYKVCYLTYRSSMNRLAQWALDRKVCRYHLRPKQRQLGHLLHCLPKNPRYLANFLSEDFIYKSKVLAEKCRALFMSKQVLQRYANFCWLAVAQHVTTNVCCVQKRSSSTMILTDLHSYPVFYLRYTRCPKTWQRTLIQVTKPDLKKHAKFSRKSHREWFFGVVVQQVLARDQCPYVFFDDNTMVFQVIVAEPWQSWWPQNSCQTMSWSVTTGETKADLLGEPRELMNL